MNRLHRFSSNIRSAPTAQGRPALILEGGAVARAQISLTFKNLGTMARTVRLYKSQTGTFATMGNPPTEGSWTTLTTPVTFTLVPNGERQLVVDEAMWRLGIALDPVAGRVSDVQVTGVAWRAMVAVPGVIEPIQTAGGDAIPGINPVTGTIGVAVNTGAGSTFSSASIAWARPQNTTAYTAGDVIGAADTVTPANAGSAVITFPNFAPAGASVILATVTLRIDRTDIPSGQTTFRLHLYDDVPTAILDNAVWDLAVADRGKYLGYIDIPAPADMGSTVWGQTVLAAPISKEIKLKTGSSTLYGQLVTDGAFTPGSGTAYTLGLLGAVV